MKVVIKTLGLVQKALKPADSSPDTSSAGPNLNVELLAPDNPEKEQFANGGPAEPESAEANQKEVSKQHSDCKSETPEPSSDPACLVKHSDSPAFAAANPTAVEKPTDNSQSAKGETGKTILFVEDDPFLLRLYKGRLEREGFRVETAADGLIALEVLPKLRPDLVILDLMLPKLHGLEVLKFIRADVNLKATPVLVLSNVYMGGLASKAMEAGANVGMHKTQCSPSTLIRTVRELLAQGSRIAPLPETGAEPKSPEANQNLRNAEASALAQARAELFKDGPEEVLKMRKDCVNYIQTLGAKEGLDHLDALYRRVRFMSGRAGLSDCTDICDLTSAFEAVLFEIVFKCSDPTPSVLRTIAHAVDSLGHMLKNGDSSSNGRTLKPKVLVVDDDAVFNYTTRAALLRANFDVVSTEDPAAALAMMHAGHFDLVLLDINMPGMDGYAVCEKLRQIPGYQSTPIIFVTMHSEFQSRARSLLTGGNDLIGKPISPVELALKASICLLDPRYRPQPHGAISAASVSARSVSESCPDHQVEPAQITERPACEVKTETPTVSLTTTRDRGQAAAASNADRTATAVQRSPFPLASPAVGLPNDPPHTSKDLVPVGTTAADSAKQRDAQAEFSKERENLVVRVYAAETELDISKSCLQRRDKTIQELRQQLEGLTARNRELEARSLKEQAASTQFDNRVTERETQLSQRLSTASAAAMQAEAESRDAQAARQEVQARCSELEQELAASRKERAELNDRFQTEQQAAAESSQRLAELEKKHSTEPGFQAELKELERRIHQGVTALAKVTAELDRERSARRRAEEDAASLAERSRALHDEISRSLTATKAAQQRTAELDEQLREREEALARSAAEMEQETAARIFAEEQLREAEEQEDEMRKSLSVFERARRMCKSTQDELEAKLNAALDALRENGLNLQHEAAERQRLADTLAATSKNLDAEMQKGMLLRNQLEAAEGRLSEIQSRLQDETTQRQHLAETLVANQRALGDQSRNSELEVARLTSALQLEEVERKRLETHVQRWSRIARNAARTGRLVRIAARRRIQQPVDEICQCIRRLGRLELEGEAKQLVETVLESALLLQTNLGDATSWGRSPSYPADAPSEVKPSTPVIAED